MAAVESKRSWHFQLKDGSITRPVPSHLASWIEKLVTQPHEQCLPVAHSMPAYAKSLWRAKAFLDDIDFQTMVVVFQILKSPSADGLYSVPQEAYFVGALSIQSIKLTQCQFVEETLSASEREAIMPVSVLQFIINSGVQGVSRPPLFSDLHANKPGLPKSIAITAGEALVGEQEIGLLENLVSQFEEQDSAYAWIPQRSMIAIWKQFNLGNDLHQLLMIAFCRNKFVPLDQSSERLKQIHAAFEHTKGYNKHWPELGILCFNDTIYTANILPALSFAFETCALRLLLMLMFSTIDVARNKGRESFAYMNPKALFSFSHLHHMIMTAPQLEPLKKLYMSSQLSTLIWNDYIAPFIGGAILEDQKMDNQLYKRCMKMSPDKSIILNQFLAQHQATSKTPSSGKK